MAGENEVIINEAICKGCGLCTVACPKQVLELDKIRLNAKGYHPSAVRHPEKCIACGMCAIMCPDSVIKVIKG
jgi:2-oxoglutarate ferredoxin oxidoreductase subunit delta